MFYLFILLLSIGLCRLNIFLSLMFSNFCASCLNVQFTMELIGNESGNAPGRYSMDMCKDVIPMSGLSESGEISMLIFLIKSIQSQWLFNSYQLLISPRN